MNAMIFKTKVAAALILLVSGCAGPRHRSDESATQAKIQDFSRQTRASFEAGRQVGISDPGFVPQLEELNLSSALFHFYAPFAGARRQLDFFEKNPDHVLKDLFLVKNEKDLYFDFQRDELFQSGNFFRNYELSLYRPVFRQVLLQYLQEKSWDEEGFQRLALALKEAARLTPRQGQDYPNDLRPPTRTALEGYLGQYPEGVIADRFRFLLLWSERNGAWSARKEAIDGEMKAIMAKTGDELLRLEIADALNAPRADPQKAFALSMLLPGLGQVNNGDVQGGVILGGLTAAAWVWLVSKMVLASESSDPTQRDAAWGDAAFAGGLVAFGHLFTAYNAHEQARFMNVVIEWDTLNKPRLR